MTDQARRSPLTDLDQAERFRLPVDAVKDYAIYLLDADGNVATWNTGAQRFKGYTAEEIIGRNFAVFYPEEDRAIGLPGRALETAAREGRFEAEGWRVRKDGTRFWTHVVIDPVVSADGEVIGYSKITRDISDKRAIDVALRKSEQRFRLLVQSVHDYAIYMLDPTGIATNWNAGAEAIKGYTADEIVGRHFSIFYTPEDRAAGMPETALRTALREGKFSGEVQRVRKNGDLFWASVLIDPIHDDAGNHLGFAKVTRDITERRLAEEELERSRQALIQAQKMEAIGRLTGGVAHDFNNLLTVIRGSADFLQRPNLSEAKRQRYILAISQTAERATVLTSQLLAFARRQPLQPEVFDVSARLRGLQPMMATTVAAGVNIVLHLPEAPQMVSADPSQFETAILNLVVNAKDAMPLGGTITLSSAFAGSVPAVRGHSPARGESLPCTSPTKAPASRLMSSRASSSPFSQPSPSIRGQGWDSARSTGSPSSPAARSMSPASWGRVRASPYICRGRVMPLHTPPLPEMLLLTISGSARFCWSRTTRMWDIRREPSQ